MVVVTGTMRSGTSMWMQILRAAGIPVLGEAFPGRWKDRLGEANPHGFYESQFRRGVYFATNPDLDMGRYVTEEELRGVAVKVFVPGVVRTERAYIERVVCTVRNWREFVPSLARLRDLDRGEREPVAAAEPLLPPHLRWWSENYNVVRDAAYRRYPLLLVSYDAVAAAPDSTVPQVISWLGAGDAALAAAAVDPAVRTQLATQDRSSPEGVEPEVADALDDIYRRIRRGDPMSTELLDRMNAVHGLVAPRLHAAADAARRRGARPRPGAA
jgi:hypothetical protein